MRQVIAGIGRGSSSTPREPVAPGHTPYLPAPTGPGPVGTTSLWLKDASRPDPWATGVNARELMVSLWYPAKSAVITWERDWKLLTGWKPWLLVAGAIHASFTDLALLADQIGIDTGAGLPGTRSLDITRAYVRAFFDQHLRGKPQALLDQPSPRYPEVTFCSPQPETCA